MRDQPSNPESSENPHPEPQPPRSPLRLVLAIAVGLTGLVWMLQGLGILTAGRSFMIGDPGWAAIGAVFIVLGVVLGVRARRPPR
ncbi:MAG: hypothetical protein V4515_08575 [Chloroflexota bacterium]